MNRQQYRQGQLSELKLAYSISLSCGEAAQYASQNAALLSYAINFALPVMGLNSTTLNGTLPPEIIKFFYICLDGKVSMKQFF